MSVSIADVSKRAGVSTMTVSRVVRGHDSVSEKKRQKVMSAIKELGYLPSSVARSLRKKDRSLDNNQTCCCLIFGKETQIADAFFRDVATAAEKEAIKHGLCLLQTHWQESFEASYKRLTSISMVSGVCGLILAGQFSTEDITLARRYSKNIVIIDGPVPSGVNIASVQADYYSGSKIALEHLIDEGARRILVIAGPEKNHYFSKALKAATELYMNQCEKIDVIDSDLDMESGVKIVSDVFKNGKCYDAIFTNDEVGLGVLRGLSQIGLKSPKDVKVIGFDNISYSAYSTPSLSTIHIDKSMLGIEAVKSLVEQLKESEESKMVQVSKILNVLLMRRESTREIS
jgi:LacI family transcriptional regulator, galactose operon repressor